MATLTTKKEIIDWISTIEDQEILLEIAGIKHKTTFNFDKEVESALPIEEAKKKSIEKIRNYWKK